MAEGLRCIYESIPLGCDVKNESNGVRMRQTDVTCGCETAQLRADLEVQLSLTGIQTMEKKRGCPKGLRVERRVMKVVAAEHLGVGSPSLSKPWDGAPRVLQVGVDSRRLNLKPGVSTSLTRCLWAC